MTIVLKKDIQLKSIVDDGVVLLHRKSTDGRVATLTIHPIQALIMSLFDGTRELDEVIEIFSEIMQITKQDAKQIINNLLNRYEQFFSKTSRTQTSQIQQDPSEFIFDGKENLILQTREPAPVAIAWVVTEDCNRRCRYCYKNANYVKEGFATDLRFPYERVVKTIEDAALIGVNSFVLTGGEPFLRPDMPEIIGHLVKNEINPIAITKMRLDSEIMQRLSDNKLPEIHLSLDSYRAEIVEQLVGVKGALEDMMITIREAVKFGIGIVLRPVITAINFDDIDELIRLTYQMGVRKYIIDVYGQTCGRHEPTFLLSDEQENELINKQQTFSQHYLDANFSLNFEVNGGGAQKGCMEGYRGLTILPDGNAVKCEHVPAGPDNTFGNLNEEDILTIWNSKQTKNIVVPKRSLFKGSACFKCTRFKECNYVRGRCSVSAKSKFGTVNAPDVYCPMGEYAKTESIELKILDTEEVA